VYIKVTTVGVQNVAGGADISVLPNPNKGTFVIRGTMNSLTAIDEVVTLELTDMLGQVVFRNKSIAKGGKLNELIHLADIANGMYLLLVRSETENRVFHLVIEQ
jgi:Secretion system C-terminal sorting domain